MSLFCAFPTVLDSCLQRACILLEETDIKQSRNRNKILLEYDKGHKGKKWDAVNTVFTKSSLIHCFIHTTTLMRAGQIL